MAFLSNRPYLFFILVVLSIFAADINAQVVDPTKTIVYGSGLVSVVAMQPAVFYVQAVDINGNNLTLCNLPFGAFIYNTTSSNTTVPNDCNMGLYSFHYQQKVAIYYTLRVTYAGQDVAGSPYHPVVYPAPIYPPSSVGSGSGLTGGQVGQYSYFTITDYDAYSNRNYTCSNDPASQWQARLTGAATIDAQVVNCSNGIWVMRYYATASGNYDIRVSLNSVNLQNSPFHISLAPGPIDASRIYATGLGSTNATAGVTSFFYIVSVDQFGNFITSCNAQPSNFLVYLQYRNNTVNATFQACSSGLYQFSYNVTISTSWSLFIFYGGILSGFSPSSITVAPSNIIEGENSKATGIGLYNGTAGVPAPFNVIPYDIFGNQITFCPKSTNFTDWTVTVRSKDGRQSCSGSVAGCTSGKFNGQYVCFIATTYSLSISYQGSTIQGSPYSPYIKPGPIDGHTSIAFGSGLSVAYAGVPATFTIDTFDQYNNNIVECVSPLNPSFQIKVDAADIGVKIRGNITACVGGNYTGQYIITQLSNLYILSINYQGNAVDNSPYSIQSISGPPYLPKCSAYGQGLNATVAGNTAQFFVTCQDVYGNPVKTCYPASYWSANLTGPTTYYANLVNCNTNTGPATWTFQYLPFVAGQYNLIIKFSQSQGYLQYPPIVVPAAFAAQNSIAIGPGVTSQNIPAGTTTSFLILSRDQYGNNVTNCISTSLLSITIKLTSTGSPITPTIGTCSQGQIPVYWKSNIAGAVTVSILYQGAPIANSPYHPAVVAGPPTGRCHAAGNGLYNAVAGQPAFFVTSCSDPYGNNVYTCYNNSLWSIVLTGPATLPGFILSCSGGSYSGTYTAYTAGNYTINISFLQTIVGGNPWHPIVSPGALNDSFSLASGPGFFNTTGMVAGSSNWVSVTSYDSYQNRIYTCTVATNYWNVSLSMNQVFVSTLTSSCNNGVYTAYYTLQLAGTYTVRVRGSSRFVANNPGQVLVVPGPISTSNSNFVANSYVVAGQTDPITITTYDRFGNRIYTCPTSSVLFNNFTIVSTLVSNSTVRYLGAVYTCNSTGNILASVQMNTTGTYQLVVSFMGSKLASSPWPVYVTSGIFSAYYSFARGPGVDPTTPIVAGAGTVFYIYLYNQYGVRIYNQSVCNTNYGWRVAFTPTISAYPSAKNATFGSCQAGVIPVYYNATWAGYYNIEISSNGQDIGGNLYHSNVIPTYLDPTKTIVSGLNNTFNTYANFTIVARDIFGNSVVNTSQSLFHVVIEPLCVQKSLTCSPVGQLLLCKFWVWEGGRYCVTVYYQNTPVGLPDSDVLIYGGLACGYGSCQNGYCFAKNVNASSYVCNCFQGYSGSSCSSRTSDLQNLSLADNNEQPIMKLSVDSIKKEATQKSLLERLPKEISNDLSSIIAGLALIISPLIGFFGYYVFDKVSDSRIRPISA